MLLELKDISKAYGKGESRVEVLSGISLGVEKGKFCVLLGPSGSGKSTLLNIIGGIDTADSGEILIDGARMSVMKEKQLTRYRRQHLGYVFQMYNLIPNLTVRENIEVGAYLSKSPLDVEEILQTLGLYEHRNKLPSQLSGGQQQRVGIARAFVTRPQIVFADEPTGNLDTRTTEEIMEMIADFSGRFHQTIILVTHDPEMARYATRIIDLVDGSVTEDRPGLAARYSIPFRNLASAVVK